MAPGRARDERKERQWRHRISQWRASGLSVRAFCARHGLATASFYSWRRVLEGPGLAGGRVRRSLRGDELLTAFLAGGRRAA
jgi:hypothetical protein